MPSSHDGTLNRLDDVFDVVICHVRAGGQTHTDLEDGLRNAIHVCWCILVYRLFVHGLPYGTCFNASSIHEDAKSFDVGVGLAVSRCGVSDVNHAGSAAHSAFHDGLVGVLLPSDSHIRVEGVGAEPVVRIILACCGLGVDLNAKDISQQLFIQFLDVLVMGDVLLCDGHLTAADAGTDVRHAVVVTDLLVLVVRVALAILSGVHHDFAPFVLVRCDQRAAARSRDHLVAVETQHAILAERAQHLALDKDGYEDG